MQLIQKGLPISVAGLALSACLGCPLRKEKIRIDRDGSVGIHLAYEASLGALDKFDALPTETGGWQVTRAIEVEMRSEGEEPKKKEILQAEQRFAPGAVLPRNLADPGDPDVDLVLDFPTEVRIEERADGTYFYFSRVYTPRRWAYVEYWSTLVEEGAKELTEKPVDELTDKEREELLGMLARVQALRQVEFTQEALSQSLPELPPEHGLIARRALLNMFDRYNDRFRAILDHCEQLESKARDACYQQEADRLLKDAYRAYLQSLRGTASLSDAELEGFMEAYARAERYYEITNTLGGHHFSIEVTMPGTIIAHNGENVRAEADGFETVVFEGFDGRAFRDRSHELLAVSRVEKMEE